MIARALIVLLLCMNVGVALWWSAHHEAPAKPLPRAEPGIGQLHLLGELKHRSAVDAVELSAEPEVLDSSAVCLSLGPFQTQAALRSAMNLLLPKVERIQFREVAALAIRGYRVYLPASANREQALDTSRALSARGVTDYYVVTAGDQQNTISLGIFGRLDNANKRHDELAALGYQATVEPRTEPVQQWWIDLAAPAEFHWRAIVTDTGIDAEVTTCH